MIKPDPEIVCRLCRSIIRAEGHVVELPSSEDPPIVHVGCAEAHHRGEPTWSHTDVQTLTQWSRGMGWGTSA